MIYPIYIPMYESTLKFGEKLKLVSSEGDLSLFGLHRTATLSASVVSILEG